MTTPDLDAQHRLLREQAEQIAEGIGATFAPICEVVLHDLLHPEEAILAIYNNLSGRKVGDPSTEIGRARASDSSYPQIVANYSNRFADGRPAKSTSIGIKDSEGRYVAAICLNLDITLLSGMRAILEELATPSREVEPAESLAPTGADAVRARIEQFATRHATTPRSLSRDDRRELIRDLRDSGLLEVRRSVMIVAEQLGVSRATVYGDAK